MSKHPPRHLFCFGLGYSAQFLAASLFADDWKVSGTVRTIESRNNINNPNWNIHIFDGKVPLDNAANLLKDVTHIVLSLIHI